MTNSDSQIRSDFNLRIPAKVRKKMVAYARFADKMFRISYRYMKSDVETEDIIIEAFGKVFKYIRAFKYQGPGSLEAWIRKIVVKQGDYFKGKTAKFFVTKDVGGHFNVAPEFYLTNDFKNFQMGIRLNYTF